MTDFAAFNILDRRLPIFRHHVLEASAGTGKTFSIENLVIRLLIEPEGLHSPPCTMQEILVVTFTRAATRELKARIRDTIHLAIQSLQQPQKEINIDFLQAIQEAGTESVKKAIRRLQQALHTFDEAQIYTIHGFCARALSERPQGALKGMEASDRKLSRVQLGQVVEDFFRSECRPEVISGAQLKQLLGKFHGQSAKLRNELLNKAEGPVPYRQQQPFSDLFLEFQQIMTRLQQQYRWTAEGLYQDFTTLVPLYKVVGEKKDRWKIPGHIEFFCALFSKCQWTVEDFDRLIREDILYARSLDPANKKKKTKDIDPKQIRCPQAPEILLSTLVPLIDRARDRDRLFVLMAHLCQRTIQRYLEEEELAAPDSLLKDMAEAVQSVDFCQKQSERFRFAIVDEFQDTDPLQWEILQRLFLSETSQTHLALVGDPKQAIYAFRDADIYTYLHAIRQLPEESRSTLAVNYRSSPELVEGINVLFGEAYNADLLYMPALGASLAYHPIQPAPNARSSTLQDGKGAVHFIIHRAGGGKAPIREAETHCFLPYMAEEILRLVDSEKRAFREITVLVRSHSQAQEVFTYLQQYAIPTLLERNGYVTDSPAYTATIELINGILHPRDHSALLQALSGPFIQWTHSDLRRFSDGEMSDENKQQVLKQVYHLRSVLQEHGMGQFAEDFVQSRWKNEEQTVLQALLGMENGLELYRDFQQIADLVCDELQHTSAGAETLLHTLLELKHLQEDEDERAKVRSDGSADAVRIMTMHVSKGLEFPIVFALGVDRRGGKQTRLLKRTEYIDVAEGEDDPHLIQQRQEEDAEKLRQAYVALTRAKERVYVPLPIVQNKSLLTPGVPSAIELLLARFGLDTAVASDRYAAASELHPEPLMRVIDRLSGDSLSYELVEKGQCQPIRKKLLHPMELIPPSPVAVLSPPLINQSFSSLSHQQESEYDPLSLPAPADWSAIDKNAHTLPAGASTGLLLHLILEKLSFVQLSNREGAELRSLIRPFLSTQNEREWEAVLATIAQTAVTTALPIDSGANIRLCDVPQQRQHREMEFLYSVPDQYLGNRSSQGFIKGYIDLIFEHEGLFHIVDWKSNWLGPSAEDYRSSPMEEAMKRHQYLLQAAIYREALRRHLQNCGIDSPDERIGNVFYLFLRGMSPERSTGIYTCQQGELRLCPA